MNWNTLIAASFFAVLNVAAFSAHADVQTASAHGAHLDIKQVISIEDRQRLRHCQCPPELPGFQRHAQSARLQQVGECGNQGG